VTESDRGWRPFWLHQAAEYLLGVILIAQGLQGTTPAVPALAGGLVVLNAAIVEGPLGAFRAVNRRQHRVLDVILITTLLVVAVLPMLNIDASSRVLIFGVAVLLGVLWWTTSFVAKAPTPATRSTDVAGWAGRMTGRAAKTARDAKAARDNRQE
jgi:hypothetical protein